MRRQYWGLALVAIILVGGLGGHEELAVSGETHPTVDPKAGWESLFNGKDLTGWEAARPGSWVVEESAIARKSGSDLWTVEQFGDFVLDLEFKVAEGTNSGVCLRVQRDPEVQPWWRDGALEVQLVDSDGVDKPTVHDCGALYDLVAPAKRVVCKPGQWHRLTITAVGSRIAVVLDGEKTVDADLDTWVEAQKNPDGAPNKYAKAMKAFPRKGCIFLQEHGSAVWFRQIFIKRLDSVSPPASVKP